MKHPRFLLLASALIVSLPAVQAATGLLELDYLFSGTAPVGATPALTVTFEDGLAPSTVRITLTALNLSADEFISAWYLNVSPSIDPTQLTFSLVSNPTQLTLGDIGKGTNAFKADGDGFYDLILDFPPPPGTFAAKFTAGEQVVVDVTRTGGLSVGDFFYQSAPGGGNGTYFSAAHVQGIGGGESGWLGATAAEMIPIPESSASALILGTVAVAIAGLRRRLAADRRRDHCRLA